VTTGISVLVLKTHIVDLWSESSVRFRKLLVLELRKKDEILGKEGESGFYILILGPGRLTYYVLQVHIEKVKCYDVKHIVKLKEVRGTSIEFLWRSRYCLRNEVDERQSVSLCE
jgi:hypothetical protein